MTQGICRALLYNLVIKGAGGDEMGSMCLHANDSRAPENIPLVLSVHHLMNHTTVSASFTPITTKMYILHYR